MAKRKRLLVIGLDCAEPSLVFDRLADRIPNLTRLCEQGTFGPLRSTDPPITMPAWISMFTGKDPGELGIFGFRNRKDHSYDALELVTSRSVTAPRVWDRLTEAGLTSYVLGVPGTYPTWPIKGRMVSSFLAPGNDAEYVYPPEYKKEVEALADGYIIDVEGFRTEDKRWLVEQLHVMTEKRFKVARAWAAEPDWDLLAMVEMGPDRLHHGFWRFHDDRHRLFEPGNEFESVIPEYYELLDREIGALLEAAGPDVGVLVVSDHGAQAMAGGFRVNEWLIEQGDLVLLEEPDEPKRLTADMVDWEVTRAWGEGGYYARIFLNVEDREPLGSIPLDRAAEFRADLAERLEQTVDEQGESLGTKVLFPEQAYRTINGIPPDLIAYFGDLAWRSIGEVGTGAIHARGNDTGPDDANHAKNGIVIEKFPGEAGQGRVEDRKLLDISGRILGYFGL